jgi:hypothetical protein
MAERYTGIAHEGADVLDVVWPRSRWSTGLSVRTHCTAGLSAPLRIGHKAYAGRGWVKRGDSESPGWPPATGVGPLRASFERIVKRRKRKIAKGGAGGSKILTLCYYAFATGRSVALSADPAKRGHAAPLAPCWPRKLRRVEAMSERPDHRKTQWSAARADGWLKRFLPTPGRRQGRGDQPTMSRGQDFTRTGP